MRFKSVGLARFMNFCDDGAPVREASLIALKIPTCEANRVQAGALRRLSEEDPAELMDLHH